MVKRFWSALRAAWAAFVVEWRLGGLTTPQARPGPTQRALEVPPPGVPFYRVAWVEPGGRGRVVETNDFRAARIQYSAAAQLPNSAADLWAYGRHTDSWRAG